MERALVVLVLVGACRASPPTHEQCRAAVRAYDKQAIVVCRTVYASTNLARDGAWLARALADHGGALDEVRALAERVGDQPGGAEAWSAVGTLLADTDLPGAIAAYRRALAHRAPTEHRNRARDATRLMDQHSQADENHEALTYADVAYTESKLDGDAELRASVLVGISIMLYNLGDLAAVEALLREAEGVIDAKNPFYPNRRHLEGLAHAERHRFELATQAFTEAAELARAQGNAELERDAKMARVGVAIDAGRGEAAERLLSTVLLPPSSPSEKAQEAFTRARIDILRGAHAAALAKLDTVAEGASPAWRGRIEAYRGRALARLARNEEAERALLRAIEYIETSRAALALDALKPWSLRDWQHAYEDLFVLYVEMQRPFDAFAIAQRATARSLLDGLVAANPAASSDAVALHQATARFDGLRSLMHSLRTSPATAPSEPRALLAALGERHVIMFFAANDSIWRIVTHGAAPPRIDRVGTALEIETLADAVVAKVDDSASAKALGELMFPSAVLPPRETTIYVSVPEQLAHVPVAALIVDADFLIRRHPIALVPNAAVLAQLARVSPRVGESIVIGDASGDLPAARLEASEVAAALSVSPRSGSAAVRSSFEAASPRVLHVATHARATPVGTALVLADGLLTAGEIVDRGITAGVVVLTSCASADPLDREELGSLANAFLAAGSRAVVAARWSVEDENARRFAAYFYAARGAEAPIQAVATAQRRMIDAGIPVTSWAVFVVLGDQ